MNAELVEFRSSVNRMISRGNVELPVVDVAGSRPLVFALGSEPLFTLLGRLRHIGGYANVFVKDGDRIRQISVVDSACAIPIPDDDMTGDTADPLASVGMFLDHLATQPNGVVLPVVNPESPAVARQLASA